MLTSKPERSPTISRRIDLFSGQNSRYGTLKGVGSCSVRDGICSVHPAPVSGRVRLSSFWFASSPVAQGQSPRSHRFPRLFRLWTSRKWKKVLLKGRIEKKLFNYRLTPSSLIDDMMSMASDADLPTGNVYVDAMSEILARVRPSLDTPSEKDRVR